MSFRDLVEQLHEEGPGAAAEITRGGTLVKCKTHKQRSANPQCRRIPDPNDPIVQMPGSEEKGQRRGEDRPERTRERKSRVRGDHYHGSDHAGDAAVEDSMNAMDIALGYVDINEMGDPDYIPYEGDPAVRRDAQMMVDLNPYGGSPSMQRDARMMLDLARREKGDEQFYGDAYQDAAMYDIARGRDIEQGLGDPSGEDPWDDQFESFLNSPLVLTEEEETKIPDVFDDFDNWIGPKLDKGDEHQLLTLLRSNPLGAGAATLYKLVKYGYKTGKWSLDKAQKAGRAIRDAAKKSGEKVEEPEKEGQVLARPGAFPGAGGQQQKVAASLLPLIGRTMIHEGVQDQLRSLMGATTDQAFRHKLNQILRRLHDGGAGQALAAAKKGPGLPQSMKQKHGEAWSKIMAALSKGASTRSESLHDPLVEAEVWDLWQRFDKALDRATDDHRLRGTIVTLLRANPLGYTTEKLVKWMAKVVDQFVRLGKWTKEKGDFALDLLRTAGSEQHVAGPEEPIPTAWMDIEGVGARDVSMAARQHAADVASRRRLGDSLMREVLCLSPLEEKRRKKAEKKEKAKKAKPQLPWQFRRGHERKTATELTAPTDVEDDEEERGERAKKEKALRKKKKREQGKEALAPLAKARRRKRSLSPIERRKARGALGDDQDQEPADLIELALREGRGTGVIGTEVMDPFRPPKQGEPGEEDPPHEKGDVEYERKRKKKRRS
jgi:hypothetical protein